MPQGGIEPPTPCLEGKCSIQLSYWSYRFDYISFLDVVYYTCAIIICMPLHVCTSGSGVIKILP